jgi:hypothetical protein
MLGLVLRASDAFENVQQHVLISRIRLPEGIKVIGRPANILPLLKDTNSTVVVKDGIQDEKGNNLWQREGNS